ncbi:hypothetical protein B0H14DRAFT_2637618 [Mycena olivaceomarginata]|nr:hypothetical protein B0H14DRAFT_2637618 [Mycena olivaceomarginata]
MQQSGSAGCFHWRRRSPVYIGKDPPLFVMWSCRLLVAEEGLASAQSGDAALARFEAAAVDSGTHHCCNPSTRGCVTHTWDLLQHRCRGAVIHVLRLVGRLWGKVPVQYNRKYASRVPLVYYPRHIVAQWGVLTHLSLVVNSFGPEHLEDVLVAAINGIPETLPHPLILFRNVDRCFQIDNLPLVAEVATSGVLAALLHRYFPALQDLYPDPTMGAELECRSMVRPFRQLEPQTIYQLLGSSIFPGIKPNEILIPTQTKIVTKLVGGYNKVKILKETNRFYNSLSTRNSSPEKRKKFWPVIPPRRNIKLG